MPWAVPRTDAFIWNLSEMFRYWQNEISSHVLFGEGEDVAVFGYLHLRSNTLGRL